jgi:hypothetical protein
MAQLSMALSIGRPCFAAKDLEVSYTIINEQKMMAIWQLVNGYLIPGQFEINSRVLKVIVWQRSSNKSNSDQR